MKRNRKKRLVIKKFRCILFLIIMFIFVSGLKIVNCSNIYKEKETIIEYTIKDKDTLWSISEEYKPEGMDKREYLYVLTQKNNIINPNCDIYPGNTLLVPILK